jgi:negative regulator of flagellin synthesis FlgM
MDIRNNLEGLKTLLGIPANTTQTQRVRNEPTSQSNQSTGDHATLSRAGAQAAQVASQSDVRAEKVASIHAALAAGTYQIPASAVASKVVDTMLTAEQSTEG